MIKQLKTTLLFLLLGSIAKAQLLTPQIVNVAGVSSSNGGILLEYSVGGLSVSTISTSTFMYTQGFLQPDAGTTNTAPIINNVALSTGSSLTNAGTTFINESTMLEFSLGEIASISLSSQSRSILLTQGILQPFSSGGTLPVTGLAFYAKRISNTTVQLDWKTLQEINNKGFHIERKMENETSFTPVGFVASNSNNGNSSLPLSYAKIDDNNFTGNTYYRLKQEDLDGRSNYSEIRIVKGNMNKQVLMQVWPIPSAGPVNVLVNGLLKPDLLMVYDISGKLVKQQNIQNNTQVQLLNLAPGKYVLRLSANKDLVQKIMVQ